MIETLGTHADNLKKGQMKSKGRFTDFQFQKK
jgi:hypothetical protein